MRAKRLSGSAFVLLEKPLGLGHLAKVGAGGDEVFFHSLEQLLNLGRGENIRELGKDNFPCVCAPFASGHLLSGKSQLVVDLVFVIEQFTEYGLVIGVIVMHISHEIGLEVSDPVQSFHVGIPPASGFLPGSQFIRPGIGWKSINDRIFIISY